ncbi:MAG: hypothetical protein ACQEUK_04890 [Pseudomonadota bacterium]
MTFAVMQRLLGLYTLPILKDSSRPLTPGHVSLLSIATVYR